jgi:ABC-type transport system substrate-binding protein
LLINLHDPILSNLKVREALSHAIDKKFIVDKVMYGFASEADGPVPSNFPIHKADTVSYGYDVKKAESLLDEAGYPRKADGWRFTLSYTGYGAAAVDRGLSQTVPYFLEQVGIKVDVKMLDPAAFGDVVFKKFDFDLAMLDFGIAGDFAIEARIYHSSAIGNAFGNCMGYNNSRIDWLFDEVAREIDPQKRLQYFYEIQDILTRDLPIIWIFERRPPQAFRPSDFGGLPVRPLAYASYDGVWWEKGTPLATTTISTPTTVVTTATATVSPTTTAPPPAAIGFEWLATLAAVVIVALIAAVYFARKKFARKKGRG